MCKRSQLLPVLVLFAVLAALTGTNALADEGMWPLYDLDKIPLDDLSTRGLKLKTKNIYDPDGPSIDKAIVQLGGGTGSFVSSSGLIITNHHVAFTAIQRQTTVEQNYIQAGFYAATRAEEIFAPGYFADITQSSDDVTDRVLAAVDDSMSPLERFQAIDRVSKEIVKEAEEGRDVKCRVVRMFGGKQFVLYTNFRIRDIRIVYVPPVAIGGYGGEVDNWMWPRHTGDFSFFRAYVAPDGSSAEFSEANVPYQPQRWLPISSAGVTPGDITLVIGFPGRTDRYISSFRLDDLANYYYPTIIDMIEDILAIYDEAAARDSSVAIRVASEQEGWRNFLKYSQALMEGFTRSDAVILRQDQESRLTRWLEENPAMSGQYSGVLPEIDQLYRERRKTREKDFVMGWMVGIPNLLDMSDTIYKWAVEKEKPDIEREQGYQNRDTTATLERLKTAQINLVPETDREILKYFMKHGLELPNGQKILTLENIFEGKEGPDKYEYLEKFLDDLYENSEVGNVDRRLEMFHMSLEELEKLDDAFITLAASLRPEMDERLERRKKRSGAQSRLVPQLIQAYSEWRQGDLYPDANSTIRLSYGFVEGYSPRDAVEYNYLTGLSGVLEKETGVDPFIVPDDLKSVFAKRDFGRYSDVSIGEIPVNFLTTNDGTGGNSGSALLNGKGEVVGLAFDSNYESVSKDYIFDPEVARSINVDIRYVLFIIDKVYHLDGLMKELKIKK